MNQDAIAKSAEHAAPIITYAGGGASILFWGIQVNEICAIISTAVAVCGLGLQLYLAWRRRHHA